MVSRKPIPVFEKNFAVGNNQEHPALLPVITGAGTLAESLPQGSQSPEQGRKSESPPDPAEEPEGSVGGKITADIQLPREAGSRDEQARLVRAAASHGNDSDAGGIGIPLQLHEGSNLLPGKQSAEVAKERKQDRTAGPERWKGDLFSLKIQDGHACTSGYAISVMHCVPSFRITVYRTRSVS